jgi:hypothetical protein
MRIKGYIALGFSRGSDKCLKSWALAQNILAKADCVFFIVHRLKPAAIEKVLLLIHITNILIIQLPIYFTQNQITNFSYCICKLSC